ncbi:hypothetical protein M0P65_07650 [Candidatus Gracilibacteria bacterium]|jgi:hypothetical protein|nr:hypothetical protein [Candidatus Gracilibacteria bacterium]
MLNALLELPVSSDEQAKDKKFEVKVDLFKENKSKEEFIELIKTEKIIEFNPNFLEVIDVDFEYNGEPFYDSYDFSLIKIQTNERWIALQIIEERYCIHLHVLKENNKGIKNDIIICLNNCSIYQLKKNELIIKPGDVGYL